MPQGFLEQVAQLQPESGEHRAGLAAGEAMEQHATVLKLANAQARAPVRMRRTSRDPASRCGLPGV
jgi:hypothetical protein